MNGRYDALIKSRGAYRSAPNRRLHDREFSINCYRAWGAIMREWWINRENIFSSKTDTVLSGFSSEDMARKHRIGKQETVHVREVGVENETAISELIDAAKDIRDNPGTDLHGSVGFCAIENPKLDRLRKSLEAIEPHVEYLPSGTSVYQREMWSVPKDVIYAAIAAIQSALGYMPQIKSDVSQWQRMVDEDVMKMQCAISELRKMP